MPQASATIELPGRYEAVHHIANGGMAAVWAADDRVLGRTVAIKLLAAHLAQDERAVHRFMREARAAATLSSHPHVVMIYDVGEHNGRPFIVMEHMAGGPLSQRLRRGRPRLEEALRWLGETAAALDAAHDRGIVHRDVKPHNLLLDERGRLGVADFGIARLAWESAVTQTGQVLGTAAYISPEQAEGEAATEASDRYSLAVVAYELLTGSKPFRGDNFAAQARQHAEELPPPPTAHVQDLRPAVDGVVLRGLAKEPEARWPTATAFVEALRRAAGMGATEPTAALTEPTRPLTRRRPAGVPPIPAREPQRASTPVPPRRPRNARPRALLPLAALLALVGAATLAFALAGGDGGGESGQATRTRPSTPPQTTASRPAPAAPAPAQQGQQQEAGATNVSDLNDRGFALMGEGRYGEAIPVLQQAAEQCGDSRETVCGYALYNLGRSLRLAGRPGEAIPLLERRLGYGDQTEVVQAELDAARSAAGVGSGSSSGDGGEGRRNGGRNGRGRGRGNSEGRGRGDEEGD
jgi:eukaryotic-like serine/threonine-protein kinase